MSLYSQCSVCKHFTGLKDGKRACKAFPEGIPDPFLEYSMEPEEDYKFLNKNYGTNKKPHVEVVPGQVDQFVFERI